MVDQKGKKSHFQGKVGAGEEEEGVDPKEGAVSSKKNPPR